MLVSLFESFRDTSFRTLQRNAQQQPHRHHRLSGGHRNKATASCLLAFFYLLVLTCLLGGPSSVSVSALSCQSTTLKGLKCLTDLAAIISTPNFPHRFETPYIMEWIIDAYGGQPSLPQGKPRIIYLYLNQMYLKTNFTVMASTYEPYDEPVRRPSPPITSTTTVGPPAQQQRRQQSGDEGEGNDVKQQVGQQQQRNSRRSVISNSFPSTERQQQQPQPQQVANNSIIKDSATDRDLNDYPDGLRPQSLVKPSSFRSRSFPQLPFDYNPRDDKSQLMVGPPECGILPRAMFPADRFSEDALKELGLIFTTCRYLSIKIELYSPYTSHIRVRDHLLDVYGFNISYSVNLLEEEPPAPTRCSAYNCTYNGHCFLGPDYKSFACHCHEGSEGRYCEYDDFKCNPAKNISFCQNGAECRLYGASHGVCYCDKNLYGGQLCEFKKSTKANETKPDKVCPSRRQCQKKCEEAAKQLNNVSDAGAIYAARMRAHFRGQHPSRIFARTETSTSPFSPTMAAMASTAAATPSCSCEEPPSRPADWVNWGLYEAILQATPNNNFTNWELKPTNRNKKSLSPLTPMESILKGRIEEKLMRELDKLYVGFPPSESVVVTSFSSESQFSFKFFGPRNMSAAIYELLEGIAKSGQLFPELKLVPSILPKVALIPQIRITNLTVNEPLPLQLNHGYSLTCTAEGSEYRSFKWFKDGIEINETLALRTVEKFPIHTQGNIFTSHLHIDHSATADQGVFTCEVSDFGGQETCGDLSISVITQPIVEILPRSLTLVQGDNGTILCAATSESPGTYSYTWYKNKKTVITDGSDAIGVLSEIHEVTEAVEPYGLLLRIVNASESAMFTCKIVNPVGTATDDMYVDVLPSSNAPSCRAEIDKYNLKWNLTGLNQTAKTFCPKNYTGFAQRVCHDLGQKPAWGSANFSRCISSELRTILKTLRNFSAGFSSVDKFKVILDALHKHISGKRSLYPGEGEKILFVLTEIGDYAAKKYTWLKELNVPPMLFQITSSLLKFPGSCVEKKSILNLIKLIHKISEVYFSSTGSNHAITFQDELLVIDQVQTWNSSDSQLFPKVGNSSQYPSWLNVQLHLDSNSTDSNGTRREPIFISVFRNVTELLGSTAPTIPSQPYSHLFRKKRDFPITDSWPTGPTASSPQYLSSQIGSPIFYFSTDFMPKTATHYFLTFTLTSELASAVQRRRKKVICGSLDDDLYNYYENVDDIPSFWIKDNHQCTLARISGNIVHCRCDRPGQYALLIHSFEAGEELPEPSLHWFILVGSIFCVFCCAFAFVAIVGHLHCHIGTNSLYILKAIVCLSLIASTLFALPLRTTESSLVLSSLLFSSLILSICCQFTKTIHVLLAITNRDLFLWLRSISALSFVMLTAFTCTLPVWISATIFSQVKSGRSSSMPKPPEPPSGPVSVYDYNNYSSETDTSVLTLDSPVFISFVATIFGVMLLILIAYYKASLELRFRTKAETSKSQLLDQRLKSLNRAVIISFATLTMITAIILHDWAPDFIPYQYFYGFATIFLGLIVLLSYTIYSEYPIPKWLIPHLICVEPTKDYDLDKAYMTMYCTATNNNTNTRTPQQAKMYGGREGCELALAQKDLLQHSHNHNHNHRHNDGDEELDDLQPCMMVSRRCRNNTFSSQNSSELETVETYGGSSLVSNNGLSMQAHQSNGRLNSISTNSVKRTNSVGSVKRSSISSVQFNIPRSLTNPQPSSSSNHVQCFPGVVMNGSTRMRNSNSNNTTSTTTASSCNCGNCPQTSTGQFWNGVGSHRQRSSSNNSMASLFGFKSSYSGKKPDREVCRLNGLDRETASYVPPSCNSTCSFPSGANSMHRPSGPISFLNSSATRLSPPPSRRRDEEYPAYVQANPSVKLPTPTSASTSSVHTSPVEHPGLGSVFSSSITSFAAQTVAGGSSGNCSNTSGSNCTLTNEPNAHFSHQGHDYGYSHGSQFDYSRRPSDVSNPYPRNGFNRQLPSVPPFSSPSAAAAKHIYAEPNLQAIVEQRKNDAASPVGVVSTDSQETDRSIYTTPRRVTSPRHEAANKDVTQEPAASASAAGIEPNLWSPVKTPSHAGPSACTKLPYSYLQPISNGVIKSHSQAGAGSSGGIRAPHPDYTPMGGVH